MVSRVTNLSLKNPELTVERMKLALREAFEAEYGPAEHVEIEQLDQTKLVPIREKYASWGWRFGTTPSFNVSFENRFSFGCFELLLNVQNGVVTSATCFTDAMDATLPERLERLLNGCPYSRAALTERLNASGGEEEREIAGFLAEQTF